jgi:L-rhamnose mutarotase
MEQTDTLYQEGKAMAAYAWILNVRPGCEAEYDHRHVELPQDMVEMLTEAGFRNYSIFSHGLMRFGYFETDDIDASLAVNGASDVARRWGTIVGPLIDAGSIDPSTNFPVLLPQVWHFEGRP